MPATVCTAKVSWKKHPGLLELTDTALQWTQDGKKAPTVRVQLSDAASLFCSKEGASLVKLKLGLVGDEEHYFTFTAPPPVALAEREKFKQELTAIISRNKANAAALPKPIVPVANGTKPPTLPHTSSSTPATPASVHAHPVTPKAPTTQPGTPRVTAHSRAASVASERRATPVLAGTDPADDFRLRKQVLLNNPELKALHRELVIPGHISEAEFWDGREHLVLAQEAAESQRKGKLGTLVDPRPETVEGGEIKIRITPQLVHDIFDEYPIVARAYTENVPETLTEEAFWKRYFQSKLFHAHRASIRSAATQNVVKDDPIFDKYLEREDDELEPRRQRSDKVDAFVNLVTSMEDHGETGNDKDITMQPGRQKAVLPLIRKFNEHSERLLSSALGDLPSSKRRRLDTESAYAPIDIEDLHDSEASAGIVLDMQDSQRYFEGRMGSSQGSVSNTTSGTAAFKQEAIAKLQNWNAQLAQLKIERKSGDAALLKMTQNVATRLDVHSRKNDIPDGLFGPMTTCQTAANEFLRQYWLATFPPPGDPSAPALFTPAQRAAKAAKMIGYISKTREKVQALVQQAPRYHVDPTRVQNALQPVLDASEHALNFHQRKKKPAR